MEAYVMEIIPLEIKQQEQVDLTSPIEIKQQEQIDLTSAIEIMEQMADISSSPMSLSLWQKLNYDMPFRVAFGLPAGFPLKIVNGIINEAEEPLAIKIAGLYEELLPIRIVSTNSPATILPFVIVQRSSKQRAIPIRIVNNRLYIAKLPMKVQLSISSTTKQIGIGSIAIQSQTTRSAHASISLATFSSTRPVVKIDKASTTSASTIVGLQEGAIQLQLPDSVILFHNVKHITELTTIIENGSDEIVHFKINKKEFQVEPHSQLIIPARVPFQSIEAAISQIDDEASGRGYKFANGVLTLIYKYIDFEIPLHRLKEFKKAHSSMSPFQYPYRV